MSLIATSLTAAEVWSRLLERAKQALPEQTYRTWLEPAEALGLEEKSDSPNGTGPTATLVVSAPDQFAADWNESKYAHLLASYAPVAVGHPITVVFRVSEERKARPQMDLFVAPAPEQEAAAKRQAGAINAALTPRYTFEHFVPGKSNELAFAAAQAVSQGPGKFYNPLFVYGATGLGKTHLMQAVAHDVLERFPNTRITLVGTEQFTNEMVQAIQTRTNHEFRRRYRETDMLLVDDVHFLKGKEGTQEEFFHTFNALYEAGRQIILTSDRPPGEIPGLEARLVSRFQWGMVADIDVPDLEHRIAILRHKAKLDHLETTIPEDVIQFIAEHVRSSVRELEGSIIKLLAYSSLKHRAIGVDLARDALRDKIRFAPDGTPTLGDATGLTVHAIQHAVAKEWGVTVDGLKSKTRTKALTTPRQVAMHLVRELLQVQLVEIGNAFGGRDHSTVIHSLERVTVEMEQDPTFKARVERVRGHLSTLRV
ncbi:MAG TPA: chromosomal replication initiator protein DnaA [Gemmatimonadaceae bacterium]|nr:chromosomal replication initiator protein DnaA [Gemmatimonadaceae bacterium]